MPAKSFTRTELHQLIWSKPLNKLAAELGLSDVGLKKLCKRYGVRSGRDPVHPGAALRHEAMKLAQALAESASAIAG